MFLEFCCGLSLLTALFIFYFPIYLFSDTNGVGLESAKATDNACKFWNIFKSLFMK